MKVKLEAVERFERDHRPCASPFRFGVITVTEGIPGGDPRAHLAGRRPRPARAWRPRRWPPSGSRRARSSPTPRISTSCARRCDLAIEHYTARGFDTPFGLFAGSLPTSRSRAAPRCGLNPLVASYGPALLDRAILDALGKATGQSFAADDRGNVPGIADDRPDAGYRARCISRASSPG